ncbi:uncharacterized protein LOC143918060 [Arctopsyche grandis]|uniref:uncharacterized protein LOC143918060 n=1 Tax=Arctopsyche grandis TaxID=121162 RepID=UPI00406D7466
MKYINYINVAFALFLISISIKVSVSALTVIELDTDEYRTINYKYPNTILKGVIEEWRIVNGIGYGVEVIIKALDLNGPKQDYILIKPGGAKEENENPLYLTWSLKTERKYRLVHLDELYIKFNASPDEEINYKGFEIQLKSLGEKITTTPPPITEHPPPLILEPLEYAYLYLKGMTAQQFHESDNSTEFKKVLAVIAENYCEKENITIAENVTILENINFHIVQNCSMNWPGWDSCISIKYSIPVNFNNITDGYELTTAHLDDMWASLDRSLPEHLQKYDAPDDHAILMAWIWVSVGVLVVFLIILYLIWRYNCFNDYVSSLLFQEEVEHRNSDASFFPIPHQVLPPLFDFDPEEKIWNDTLPPEFNENSRSMEGQINPGFEKDTDLFYTDCDDEIHMALDDPTDHRTHVIRRSVDTIAADESNL